MADDRKPPSGAPKAKCYRRDVSARSRQVRICAASALAAGAFALSTLEAQPRQPAEALATRLQQHYREIDDFEADFVQTFRSTVLRGPESRGQGHVYVKKPGRMKWVYVKPDRQEMFWTGQQFILFYPDSKEATITDVSPEDQSSASLLFLAGKGDLVRDFLPMSAESTVAGASALRLTPRKPEPDFDYFIVTFDEKTMKLRKLVTRNNLGDETTTDFSNLKENAKIPDRTFVFNPPKGIQINGGRGR
jgi:outer membrane lipoprotein carrier protein